MVNKHNEQDDTTEDSITSEDTVVAAEEQDLKDIEQLGEDKLKTLREKNKRLNAEKRDALEELARVKADFLNARKRLEEDKQRGIERQKLKDIEALLPLCDSFQMAMQNEEKWNSVDESWRKGVEGIHAQLHKILTGYGVESFDPTGESFDPSWHEALSTTDSDSDPDTIVETLQHGYKMGDTVIRHAKVIISS
jgi:molecular chaperone GrpE